MTHTLQLGVSLGRVRVRTHAAVDRLPRTVSLVGYVNGRPAAARGDHRLTIDELRLDIEAGLDDARARDLGRSVARDLATRLVALQTERYAHIVEHAAAGGPIHVASLHLRLCGEATAHPLAEQLASTLATALAERVRDAQST